MILSFISSCFACVLILRFIIAFRLGLCITLDTLYSLCTDCGSFTELYSTILFSIFLLCYLYAMRIFQLIFSVFQQLKQFFLKVKLLLLFYTCSLLYHQHINNWNNPNLQLLFRMHFCHLGKVTKKINYNLFDSFKTSYICTDRPSSKFEQRITCRILSIKNCFVAKSTNNKIKLSNIFTCLHSRYVSLFVLS